MKLKILGTGRQLPEGLIPSSVLDERCGLPDGTLENATGVRTRYFCDQESQVDLAAGAARQALADAGLSPDDVDLVLCASGVSYQPIPSMAPILMNRLGIGDGSAAGFDVNSTCLSFLTAFEMAQRFIESGQYRRILVVSSEIASRALPWNDQPEVAALFGDGAAAFVLGGGERDGSTVRASLMRTFPSAVEACAIGAGGTRFDYHNQKDDFARHAVFRMDGRDLFRITSRYFADFVTGLLDRAGWARGNVDLVVPHQASPLALSHMIRRAGFDPSVVVDIAAIVGNQIAASIPFAFDFARREARLAPGMKVLMLGTSAGVSIGGVALEY